MNPIDIQPNRPRCRKKWQGAVSFHICSLPVGHENQEGVNYREHCQCQCGTSDARDISEHQ